MGLSNGVFRAAARLFLNMLFKQFFTASLGVSIDRHGATPGLSLHLPTQKSSSAEESIPVDARRALHTVSAGPREEEAVELSLTVYTEHKINTPHLLANHEQKKPEVVLES